MLTSKLYIQSDFFLWPWYVLLMHKLIVVLPSCSFQGALPFLAMCYTSARTAGRAIKWLLTLLGMISAHQNAIFFFFLSKCKVSHSYSLKCKMNINETDVITAKHDRRSEWKASRTLVACKVIKMDFHQRGKKVWFCGWGVFFFHKAYICPTPRGKWPGNCSSTFLRFNPPNPPFFFFPLKDMPGNFPHWLYTIELHKTVRLCKTRS